MIDEVDSWYSCIVVAVCFVVYFMNYSILRVSGFFFPAIISFYNVDRERASTPFLAGSIARSISGPICGYLSHTFGFRFVILLGCFLSSLGIFACSFAKDIIALCAFWSVYGFGCGLSTSILPQVINMFNPNHASKANGIAMCGAPFAGVIFTFITISLLDAYGMPGTFLNLSAIMLNAIPCVLFLRNPNTKISNSNHCKKNNGEKEICAEENTMPEGDKVTSLEICSNYAPCSLGECKDQAHCMHNQVYYISSNEHTSHKELSIRTIEKSLSKSQKELVLSPCAYTQTDQTSQNVLKESFDHVLSETPIPVEKKQNCLKIFSVLLDPLFIVFTFPRCLCVLLIVIVPTILVDFSIDKGIEEHQATYVLVASSVADLFGKVCLGWITDGNHMSRTRYVALWFCIIAFSCGLMAWSNGFAVMTVAVCLQSVGVATVYPTTFVLISEYFEKEEQSMAIASTEIFLLPLWFGTSPLIGYFRDDLGSYDGLVYIFCGISILCTVLVLLIPTISKWKIKRIEDTRSK